MNESIPNKDRDPVTDANTMFDQVTKGLGIPPDTFQFPWPRKPLGKPAGGKGGPGGKSAGRSGRGPARGGRGPRHKRS